MLSAELEWANATKSQSLVNGIEGYQIHVHSIVMYLQGTDPGDQIQVSAAFPSGVLTQIGMLTQKNIGGWNANCEANLYPDLLLPDGCGLHVAGVVTGVGEYTGAFVIYSLVPAARPTEPEPQQQKQIYTSPFRGWGIPGLS